MKDAPCMYQLKGIVQHYSWGGHAFIPDLLGEKNPEGKPWAEYWLGAHPNFPALAGDTAQPLDQFLQHHPQWLVDGESLPYLLKVLDVRQMLSIQVHPSKDGAAIGYDEEDAKGIPVSAANRNYRDRNHKPEMMVALGDFWLLHGFRNETAMKAVFKDCAELQSLQPFFENGSYLELYAAVMEMAQEEVNAILEPLSKRLLPSYHAGSLHKSSPDFWAARAMNSFCQDGRFDRGIFSIYFFNLLHLKKGEGIFQPAGLPHAYLEGQNIEVMANSDNVLRAGLTDKHIDVAELMKHTRFVPTDPLILQPGNGAEHRYATPAEEFELTKIVLQSSEQLSFQTASPETLLVMRGSVTARCNQQSRPLNRGAAVFIGPGQDIVLKCSEPAELYRVSVPLSKKQIRG